jgi:tellurite methyltransferase
VIRTIVRFGQDDHGDWVAHLSCLHRQHIRHQPPFQERPWILTDWGRAARMGSDIDCPLCDRAELPNGLRLARTAGPFDGDSLPAGLLSEHRVAGGTWGVLRILQGSILLSMATDPVVTLRLVAGDRQGLPPGVPHALTVEGPIRLDIDFLVPDDPGTPDCSR